jgi:signal transduction histidine kinase
VLTSTLTLASLVRAVSAMSKTVRLERAEQAIDDEVQRLARSTPGPQALAQPATPAYMGMRGGWVRGPGEIGQLADLPPSWRVPLEQALRAVSHGGPGKPQATKMGDSTLLIGVRAARAGGYAFCGYMVQPSLFLQPWRYIVAALSVATLLMIAGTAWGVLAFRRASSSLHATLIALGKDLSTPVPAPRVSELTGIADAVRQMAAELLASRAAAERLGGELAAQQRLAALGRVVAGVAHEVRNPLASIKLRIDLTAADAAEPTRLALEAASQEISRLDRLVSDLLLVAGKKLVRRRGVDVGALLRERAAVLRPWSDQRAVTLRIEGAGSAELDPESVARAIDNLLRNAVDASPCGAEVCARVVERAQRIEVQIEDDGPGVKPARLSELFEPFFTTKPDGTGLGLAVSRAIARAHRGELDYARVDDRTRFTLCLPRHAAGDDQVQAA